MGETLGKTITYPGALPEDHPIVKRMARQQESDAYENPDAVKFNQDQSRAKMDAAVDASVKRNEAAKKAKPKADPEIGKTYGSTEE